MTKGQIVDVYEVMMNNDPTDTYDPVVKITIHTDVHSYDFKPEEIKSLYVRKFKRLVEND